MNNEEQRILENGRKKSCNELSVREKRRSLKRKNIEIGSEFIQQNQISDSMKN